MIRPTGLVLALLASSPVIADANYYSIQCRIMDAGRLLGAPTVWARSGNEVSVSVSDTYELSLIAERQGDDQVKVSATITINGTSHSPTILVDLDTASEIRIGDTTLTVMVSDSVADGAR